MAESEQRPTTRSARVRRRAATARFKEPDLPKIAADSHDLNAIRKAVEDAAAVSGGLWLSYLFVLFYIAIAAGAVTHADLLLENSVKLPFLNIELPLKAFFFLAPILFLITHAYTLVYFVLLADKAKRFHLELREQIKSRGDEPESDDAKQAAEIRDGLRRQLPSNIFVQFLAGPANIREGWFGLLLKVIAWATLVVAPILLLLLLQIQFLPYHDLGITWTHRIALFADLLLLWWLWRAILSGRSDSRPQRGWTRRIAPALGFVASIVAVLFSCAVATFPREWRERPLSFVTSTEPKFLNAWLFHGEVDHTIGRRASPFSNTLVLSGFNLFEALKIDDPEKVKWRKLLFHLRGRDLEGAVLDFAVLPKVDFEHTNLQGASLVEAQLQGAWFDNAKLQRALLDNAVLQGASLDFAQLQDVHLNKAQLQGASFVGAQLQGASLVEAQLQGASLKRAYLQGASLRDAQLEGASLYEAQLQGASLVEAQLQGASLVEAQLQGASLVLAQLQGSSVDGARLQGASLVEAQLQGASFGASSKEGQWPGEALRSSDLTAADLESAFLWRADLGSAKLESLSAENLRWTAEIGPRRTSTPWREEDYFELKRNVERNPAGDLRTEALARIEILDCETKTDWRGEQLAPCGSDGEPPPIADNVDKAIVDKPTYMKALADSLGTLVCDGSSDAIFVLRGLLDNRRFEATGVEPRRDLVTRTLSTDCPVSAALTEEDKAKLRHFQRSCPGTWCSSGGALGQIMLRALRNAPSR
jgi:uncharacterized protein YjbI with pentapeptide repeats